MTTVLDTCYSVSHWQEAPKPETDDNENKNRIENRTQEKRSVVVTLMFTASLTCAVVDCGFLSRGSHYSRTFYVMTVGLQNPITLAASQFHCLWFGRAPESQCEETLTCWTQDSLHFLFFVILRSFFFALFGTFSGTITPDSSTPWGNELALPKENKNFYRMLW